MCFLRLSPVLSVVVSCALALCAFGAGAEPTADVAQKIDAEMAQVRAARAALAKAAAQGTQSAPRPQSRLTLRAAVDVALLHNFGLQISRYQPSIAADDIESARARFDPTLTMSANFGERVSPTATTSLEGASVPETKTQSYGATVSQRLVTGAVISAGTSLGRDENNSTNSTLNPYYASQTGINITQPLLAGGGVYVNLAPVAIAKASHRQTKYELRRDILDLMADIELAYWNLSAAYALKDLRETSVRLAHAMLEENRERARLGVATHADVLEAEAYLAARLESIILARQSIDNAEDALRRLLGELSFSEETALATQALPAEDPGLPEFQDVVRAALAQDYAYFVQEEEIEKQRIRIRVAQNANQPAFNVTAGMAGLGVDRSAWAGYSDSYRANGNRWNAGVVFSLPIGLRAEAADERKAMKNLDVARLKLAQVQQELVFNVRKAWRDVGAGRQRRATTLASLELNLESYRQQHAQYRAGLISLRDLLQAQTDLDAARINHLQAAYDLIAADVALKRLTGEILERNGFRWTDVETKPDLSQTSATTAAAEPKKTAP